MTVALASDKKKEMEERRKKAIFKLRDAIVEYYEAIDDRFNPSLTERRNMLQQSKYLEMAFDKVLEECKARWTPPKKQSLSIARLIREEKDPEKLRKILSILENM